MVEEEFEHNSFNSLQFTRTSILSSLINHIKCKYLYVNMINMIMSIYASTIRSTWCEVHGDLTKKTNLSHVGGRVPDKLEHHMWCRWAARALSLNVPQS